MTLKSDAKFKEKLTFGFKCDMRNLANFHPTTKKSKNSFWWAFISQTGSWFQKMKWGIWLILMQAVASLKICLESVSWKVQKNYLSWCWKKIQTLKKKWLFIWKMTWGIWWTLTRAVERLKICTLMGYFCRKYAMFKLKKYRGVVSWKMSFGFKYDINNLVNFHTSTWK